MTVFLIKFNLIPDKSGRYANKWGMIWTFRKKFVILHAIKAP